MIEYFGVKIKLKHYKWFKGKNGYMVNAVNSPEREQRLKWLSEGSLAHHMTLFESPISEDEKVLFQEFLNYCKNESI